MKILRGLLVLVIQIIVVGCSHAPKSDTVAMKINDQEAHVALSPAEVKPGDRIAFIADTCAGRKGTSACHNTKVAEGVVTANLNDKYAAVRILPGGNYQEGTRVEIERS